VENLFYFPQNSVYVIVLSLSIQTIFMFFINLVHKFKYQTGHLKVTKSLWITFKGAKLWVTLLDIPALK
jgi:hypothetical protein